MLHSANNFCMNTMDLIRFKKMKTCLFFSLKGEIIFSAIEKL
eukprot:UN06757